MRNISFGGTFAHFTELFYASTVEPPAKIRELKQQRRRLLRKRLLKSDFALLQTLSRLFHLVQVRICWKNFSVIEV